MDYQFPVQDLYHARTVLEPDFDIMKYPDLYVNLDAARIKTRFDDYRKKIKRALNIDEETNRLLSEPMAYKKILFTGYRGSGKTTELRKLAKEITRPDGYFTIFIELEQEYNITRFQPEDFYFILFYKFSKRLEADPKLRDGAKLLSEIIRDLISDKETMAEIKRRSEFDVRGRVGGGANLLNWFMSRLDLGMEFSRSSIIADKIRTRIKTRLTEIIDNFNEKLRHIRRSIQRQGKGRDILFIIDGMEKVPRDVYESLVVMDNTALRNINANIVMAFPIETHFHSKGRVSKDSFDTFLLPVIRVDDFHNRMLLAEVIKRRIAVDKFFESEDVLDYLVQMSGGLIRQLFRLVSFCLLYADEPRLRMDETKEIVEEYGRIMYESLNSKHLKVLRDLKFKKKQLQPANEEEGHLLFNLFVLKFNGEYVINPVIDNFIR